MTLNLLTLVHFSTRNRLPHLAADTGVRFDAIRLPPTIGEAVADQLLTDAEALAPEDGPGLITTDTHHHWLFFIPPRVQVTWPPPAIRLGPGHRIQLPTQVATGRDDHGLLIRHRPRTPEALTHPGRLLRALSTVASSPPATPLADRSAAAFSSHRDALGPSLQP
ncbi:hypothetical protein ACL02R_17015 [Streptomyces sp. MS19]|uniref:hypothetical protein n=1 Tax=Streptomyces sp. MS19 TaxID=3385972 RepID=UPI0039A1FB92